MSIIESTKYTVRLKLKRTVFIVERKRLKRTMFYIVERKRIYLMINKIKSKATPYL